jgi:hypothetical protein
VDPDSREAAGATVEGEDANAGDHRIGRVERNFGGDFAAPDQGAAATGESLASGGVAQAGARADGKAGGVEPPTSAEGELDPLQPWRRSAGAAADAAPELEEDRDSTVPGKDVGGDPAVEGDGYLGGSGLLGRGWPGYEVGEGEQGGSGADGEAGEVRVPHSNLEGL